MKTTTFLIEDYQFESVNPNGNKVQIDMRAPDEKQGQSPTELLLSALSSCASVDLVQMLKKRKRTIKSLNIQAEGQRKEEHPRAFTDITLHFTLDSPDTTIEEFEKFGALAATKYCSVAATLNANIQHRFTLLTED